MRIPHLRVPTPEITGLSDLRVLLADDSQVTQLVTGDLLSRLGIKPRIVGNGAQALELAFADDFDVILMEVEMPVMDGIVATNRLREFESANPSRKRVPVVAYTKGQTSQAEAVLLRVGMDAVLEKPCGVLAMIGCLHRVCASKLAVH